MLQRVSDTSPGHETVRLDWLQLRLNCKRWCYHLALPEQTVSDIFWLIESGAQNGGKSRGPFWRSVEEVREHGGASEPEVAETASDEETEATA